MQVETRSRYLFTPISCGVDWITATQHRGSEGRGFLNVGESLLDDLREAGGQIKPASLRDYSGFRGEGLFVGFRDADNIIQATGTTASTAYRTIAQEARNVSRLDLQITLWTHGEQPRLALHTYRTLARARRHRGRVRSLTYIESQPSGETIYIGKRTSDQYGRLYDKASESKLGAPRTLWRYEVELKRKRALAYARGLQQCSCPESAINNFLHGWFSHRGSRPAWSQDDRESLSPHLTKATSRDILRWMETSLRVTVSRAINRHGVDAVLSALGLSDYVTVSRRA